MFSKILAGTAVIASLGAAWYYKHEQSFLPFLGEPELSTEADAAPKAEAGEKLMGVYFPNWGQYRMWPYTYTPEKLDPIVDRLTHVFYGFLGFCPPKSVPNQPYWV